MSATMCNVEDRRMFKVLQHVGTCHGLTREFNIVLQDKSTIFCPFILSTAGIGRMGLFSARLVHSFLCSIYGVKNDHQKNMPRLQHYVANSLVPLRPKAIKYGLTFRKWTIRNISKLCQNSITFLLNFQFEKKVP